MGWYKERSAAHYLDATFWNSKKGKPTSERERRKKEAQGLEWNQKEGKWIESGAPEDEAEEEFNFYREWEAAR